MNMNELARRICKIEGQKKILTIADVKEVLNCFAKVLAEEFATHDYKTIDAFENYAEQMAKKLYTKKQNRKHKS